MDSDEDNENEHGYAKHGGQALDIGEDFDSEEEVEDDEQDEEEEEDNQLPP